MERIVPVNDKARSLLNNLPSWLDTSRVSIGKFGVTNDTCIGIDIMRSNEAFRLGAHMGDHYGDTRMSSVGTRKILVFPDARARF